MNCPLCSKSCEPKQIKSLYGYQVCKSCFYGFANRRQFAFILDSLFFRIFVYGIGFFAAIFFVAGEIPENVRMLFFDITGVVLWLFFLCKDGMMKGASPGKKILGLQVVDLPSGNPIGFPASFKRNLPLIVPIIPAIVAFTLLRGKRLGDGWAKTKVVWTKYKDREVFASKVQGPYPPSGGVSFAMIIAILFTGLLLTAIAVPNLMRARANAQSQTTAPAQP